MKAEYRQRVSDRYTAQLLAHYNSHATLVGNVLQPPMKECSDPLCIEADRALYASVEPFIAKPPEERYYE